MSNQLELSLSPYLRQHKDNPVNWQPWGDQILREATERNVPILVSIGYSTCHWCHVMAHESFEDHHIAQIMNERFVNVKIDREERPDLDHYFMDAVQLLGVNGGWPLHCFLTPKGKVFYDGTYFPPVRKYGRMSWAETLMAVSEAYHRRRIEIEEQSDRLNLAMIRYHSPENKQDTLFEHSASALIKKFEPLTDYEHGGFGFGQKFPSTMALNLLLDQWLINRDEKTFRFLTVTVRNLCLGGMCDHVAGGFYRYTVDRGWRIPHFEKMAYDHALINTFLSRWIHITGTAYQVDAVRRSLSFWKSHLRGQRGLYYAAQDADSEGQEGLYYLWTSSELLTLKPNPTMLEAISLVPLESGHAGGVLNLLNTPPEGPYALDGFVQSADEFWRKMELARSQRPAPQIDKKFILGWNCLIVSMLCENYFRIGDISLHEEAVQLMEEIIHSFRNATNPARWYRICYENENAEGDAFLEDYAYLIQAVFDVWQVSESKVYRELYHDLLASLKEIFSMAAGIFSFSGKWHHDGLAKMYILTDSSLPNANAVIARQYYLASQIFSSIEYFRQYELMLETAMGQAPKEPFSFAGWIRLLPELLGRTVMVKCRNRRSFNKYLQFVKDREFIYFYTDELGEDETLVCAGMRCSAPIQSTGELIAFLEGYNPSDTDSIKI